MRLVTGLDTQAMRIPHYLVLSASGVYHFRLKVPAAAQAALGVRVLKQSLRTRDTRTAQIHSSLLYLRYASAIAAARGGDVMPKPPSVEDLLASFQQGGIRPFELELDPATRFPTRIQTDGSPQDNAAALEAMKVVFATPLPARALPSLDAFSRAARAKFLDSLVFTDRGLGSYRTADIEAELTPRQANAILSLFGVQDSMAQLDFVHGSEAERQAAKSIGPIINEDHREYRCMIPATCIFAMSMICIGQNCGGGVP